MSQGDFKAVLDRLPFLQDKCAVDCINAIHVGKERIRFLEEQDGFASRLVGALTGKTQRHMQQVAGAHQIFNEKAIEQFALLYEHVTLGHRAISVIHTRVSHLQAAVSELGGHLVDVMDALNSLEDKVGSALESLDQRLKTVELRLAAEEQLDFVFSKLEAGGLDDLPISRRVYLAYEELYWGAFGLQLSRLSPDALAKMTERLKNKSISYLLASAKLKSRESRYERGFWFGNGTIPHEGTADFILEESTMFLGDWSDKDQSPFAYAAVNTVYDGAEMIYLPHLFSVDRLVSSLNREVFERRESA